ncbi:MAG TPA: hypothetical protein P5317_13110 [Myxococcota bacterium]|jgi:hypothetical protein|nr:hypothetical protein [Myxococcota bacterium]
MNARVAKYKRTITNIATNKARGELVPFTTQQAMEIGAVLEHDGLAITAAIKLCDKWNRTAEQYSKNGKFRLSYSVPFVKKERTDA